MSRQKRLRALALAFGVLLSGTPAALAQQKDRGKRAARTRAQRPQRKIQHV
jgi:pectin methylesterase-like acyl-CoA thioesterase